MSLLNKNTAFNVRDYLFVAVGLLCVFWFFLSYPSQEPRSTIPTNINKNAAVAKASAIFEDLGFSVSDQNRAIARFSSNGDLLDSLQSENGRQKMISTFSKSHQGLLYPYYWEVDVGKMAGESDSEDQEGNTTIRLNNEGKLTELINPSNFLPERRVNREAIIAAFDADRNLKLWKSLPDSAWDRILRFNMEEGYDRSGSENSDTEAQSDEYSHTYRQSNIEKLANFHLQNTAWNNEKLELADIQIETIHSRTMAEVSFVSVSPVLGQEVALDLRLLPTGALINLTANYNPDSVEQEMPGVLELIRLVVSLLFALSIVILFFFRIRSRAIDTHSALVVGIVAGFVIPATIFLEEWETMPLFGSGSQSMDLVGLALQMGFMGAFSSIGFFALFAVGDSLMRQYWPDKLYSYDFLRQGKFFNKPIGEMILRSIVLSFILCGIWTLALFFFPELYFEVERTFLTYEAAWAPIYVFLDGIWFSLIVTLIIFSVVGTQVYGLYKKQWLSAVTMILGVILLTPVMQAVGPDLHETIFFGVTGVALTVIFLKWDVLTTFFTHLLFILMLEVSSGWIVTESPDFYIVMIFFGFLLFNIVTGMLFITRGEEQHSLSSYVPDYVEELAQEERIKQELQIAREVQQSFLPVKTPQFKELDLAAICKPAYETGGDYYDFVQLDDHRVAVTIGDVSGKGIQAAFYMTFIKGILHSLCREVDSPSEILKKTNRLFYDNAPRGTFISLIYGIIDLKKQTFHFARAGHNPVLRINSKNGEVKELQPKGIGIGLSQGHSFDNNIENLELKLCEDDILVLYTDGIVEALNEKHQFYGTGRLNKLLNSNKEHSAAELLRELSKDLQSYIGRAKQHDDMTMVIMKLKKQ